MRFVVERGHVLAFSRALGKVDAGADVVSPTFAATTVVQDPDHMRGMRPAGALAAAERLGGTVLHAEQRFEYLAPLCVGDVLEATQRSGRTWTKPRASGGELLFTELVTELRDSQDELVVRSTMVLVRTDAGGQA